MSITASIVFKTGEKPKKLIFHTHDASDKRWRFVAYNWAVELVPICGKPLPFEGLFNRLDIKPCRYGDPGLSPDNCWIRARSLRNLSAWTPGSDSEPTFNPKDSDYFLAQPEPKIGRTIEHPVTHDDLPRIRYRAHFRSGEDCQIIHLAHCKLARLTKEEKRLLSGAKPSQHTRKKSVARFEKNFTLALIPQTNGPEKEWPIGDPLRTMIQEIINEGGKLAGPTLIERMKNSLGQSSPNTRPDKLLRSSAAAKALVEAGLVGKNDPKGRIVVYWAKRKAD